MALPGVNLTVLAGGLGVSIPGAGNQGLEAGWATGGPGGVVLAFADTGSVQLTYTSGQLVEDACFLLATGAPSVLCTRIFSGSLGATTGSGGGANSDVTFSGAPMSPYGIGTVTGSQGIIVKIILGGAIGTATFAYSTNGGATFSTAQLVPGTPFAYIIPQTGVTITFANVSFTTGAQYIAPITSAVGSVSAIVPAGVNGNSQGKGLITTTGSSPIDDLMPIVKITTSGLLGVGQFQYSFDGGLTYSAVTLIPSGGGPVVIGNGIQLTFGNSGVQASLLVQSTTGGSGITWTAVPGGVAGNSVQVIYNAPSGGTSTAAIVGTTITVSPKSGETNTGLLAAISSAVATLMTGVVTGTGGDLIVARTVANLAGGTGGQGATNGFVATDTYSFTTSRPSYTTTDVTNVTNNIVNNPNIWGWMHFIGQTSTPSTAATFASIVATQMTMFASNARYCFGIVECPYDPTGASIDLALQTAFTSFANDRVMVCAGDGNCNSPIQGTEVSRSAAWPVAARCATVPVGHDLGEIQDTSLSGVVAIDRDESQTPNLDSFGFTTLTTIRGEPGFWITNGRMMTSANSAFQLAQFRRVMDVACVAARAALLYFLNASVRVNTASGVIIEQDARTIENYVTSAINSALGSNISGCQVQVSRTHNILIDNSLPVTLGLVPLGYMKFINASIGYVNPALALVA